MSNKGEKNLILVVEDEKDWYELIHKYLDKKKFILSWQETGEGAIEEIKADKNKSIKGAIVDWFLKGKISYGKSVISYIIENRPDIAIIVLSWVAREPEKIKIDISEATKQKELTMEILKTKGVLALSLKYRLKEDPREFEKLSYVLYDLIKKREKQKGLDLYNSPDKCTLWLGMRVDGQKFSEESLIIKKNNKFENWTKEWIRQELEGIDERELAKIARDKINQLIDMIFYDENVHKAVFLDNSSGICMPIIASEKSSYLKTYLRIIEFIVKKEIADSEFIKDTEIDVFKDYEGRICGVCNSRHEGICEWEYVRFLKRKSRKSKKSANEEPFFIPDISDLGTEYKENVQPIPKKKRPSLLSSLISRLNQELIKKYNLTSPFFKRLGGEIKDGFTPKGEIKIFIYPQVKKLTSLF